MNSPGGAQEAIVSVVASPRLLDVATEISDDAIFACDPAGLVATWSTAAERLAGRPVGEVLGSPLPEIFPEHLRSEVWAVTVRVLAGDRVHHFETEVLRPDGLPVPVFLSMAPVHGGDGSVVGCVAVVRDITEQRLAQATLAEVEARLEEGEALAHAGSWLWDLRTGTVQWSAEFHRIHGIDPLDFDGTFESHLGLIHPAERDLVQSAMEESVESGRPLEATYRVVHPNGDVRLIHVRAQPTIGSAGNAVGLRGIGQDVTDRTGGPVSPH